MARLAQQNVFRSSCVSVDRPQLTTTNSTLLRLLWTALKNLINHGRCKYSNRSTLCPRWLPWKRRKTVWRAPFEKMRSRTGHVAAVCIPRRGRCTLCRRFSFTVVPADLLQSRGRSVVELCDIGVWRELPAAEGNSIDFPHFLNFENGLLSKCFSASIHRRNLVLSLGCVAS